MNVLYIIEFEFTFMLVQKKERKRGMGEEKVLDKIDTYEIIWTIWGVLESIFRYEIHLKLNETLKLVLQENETHEKST